MATGTAKNIGSVPYQKGSSGEAPQKRAKARTDQIRFRTTLHNTVFDVFKARGWKETDSELDWDIFWADKEWIREVYDHVHLDNHQRVNHFRNHYELTRKDLLIKNLKRAKRILEKEGNIDEANNFDFFPTTFNLPAEYSMFVEAFKKNPNSSWIMKPIGKSQGRGIFLFDKLSQISDWRNHDKLKTENPQAESYIVQEYIKNPFLIGGKKFDVRVYALVTSYSPLTVYLARCGFARFSSSRYSSSDADLRDNVIHLTNVAVQKTAPRYDTEGGGKMSLRNLKLYMMSRFGHDRINQLFFDMQSTIIRSLLSVQKVMINDKHSFELYGYDLLVDENFKVWLLEANASPSLSSTSAEDKRLKFELIDDVCNILDLENKLNGDEDQIGCFDLVYRNGAVRFDSNCTLTTYLGCNNNREKQLRRITKRASKTAGATARNEAR